jgi:hypothetical protein
MSARRRHVYLDDELTNAVHRTRRRGESYQQFIITAVMAELARRGEYVMRSPTGRCIVCGKPFIGDRVTRLTCSDACRTKRHREAKAV